MNDRELLEWAAKAAGLHHPDGWDWLMNDLGYPWNPLDDDGDAFRLAVQLKIDTYINHSARVDYKLPHGGLPTLPLYEDIGSDPCAAMRRAIVRAAAKIGKSMQ